MVGLISVTLSSPVCVPSCLVRKECGLLSWSAAYNQAYQLGELGDHYHHAKLIGAWFEYFIFLLGHPTNYGLLQKLQEKWKKEAAMESLGTNMTTYKLSYNPHQKESFSFRHYAPPKSLSCHFHPHCVNKDLHLRGKQMNSAPEFPPTLAVPHNVPPDFPQSTILMI